MLDSGENLLKGDPVGAVSSLGSGVGGFAAGLPGQISGSLGSLFG
ncbi:hypothetical protein [Streptomyces sp. NPDC059262]